MKMVPVDRSKVDAELLARTLERLIQQQGGPKVEVISTEELLKQQKKSSDAGEAKPATGAMLIPSGAIHGARWLAASAAFAQVVPPADESDGVTIAVDPKTNALILLGSPRATERVALLAEMLQKQMPAEPSSVRVVTLPGTLEAQSVAQVVNQTLQQIGRASSANPGGFTGAVSVQADPGGGSLIVVANDTDFKAVGELIASIARMDSSANLTVKVYPLSTISPQRAREAILDLISRSRAASRPGASAAWSSSRSRAQRTARSRCRAASIPLSSA